MQIFHSADQTESRHLNSGTVTLSQQPATAEDQLPVLSSRELAPDEYEQHAGEGEGNDLDLTAAKPEPGDNPTTFPSLATSSPSSGFGGEGEEEALAGGVNADTTTYASSYSNGVMFLGASGGGDDAGDSFIAPHSNLFQYGE